MDALQLDTVLLSEDRSCLEILDQTLLPGTVKVLRVEKLEDIFEAIRFLRVRGAPAIGVCAAYGIALTASRIETRDYEAFLSAFREQKKYLASSRPTAVNLFWALDRMERTLLAHADKPVEEIKECLLRRRRRSGMKMWRSAAASVRSVSDCLSRVTGFSPTAMRDAGNGEIRHGHGAHGMWRWSMG